MSTKLEVFEKMQQAIKEVNEKGVFPIVTFLHGSQNYGVDTENSDIDLVGFVLPSKEDLYNKKEISQVYVTSFGNFTIKDIRLFAPLLAKMNLTYLELLQTPYVIVDPEAEDLFDFDRESFLNDLAAERETVLYSSIGGYLHQKIAGLFKETDSKKEIIQAYGYNLKEFHHLVRLESVFCELTNGEILSGRFFRSENQEFLVQIKTGEILFTVEEVKEYAEGVLNALDEFFGLYQKKNIQDTSIDWLKERVKRFVLLKI